MRNPCHHKIIVKINTSIVTRETTFSIGIRASSAVPQAYKYDIVKDMLRYPCGLRQVLRMPVRVYCYHLLMWAASRLPIPHLGLKVFVVRAVNAVAMRIFLA
jgi:hypothetical protein